MYLLELLRQIPDSRGLKGREFPLAETLLMVILGTACGYTSYRKLEKFIDCKWTIFKRYLSLKRIHPPKYNGLRKIILSVESSALENVFRQHALALVNFEDIEHLAADGKHVKGSRDYHNDNQTLQFLNIFAVNEKLILAHEVIDNKTNEIPVFQSLLEELQISRKALTADALHCQKKR